MAAKRPAKRKKLDPQGPLRAHVRELLRGGHAHLVFKDVVADWPTALRGARPAGQPFTPWRLLEHIRITQWDIVEFTQSAKHVSPEWPAGSWHLPGADTPPEASASHTTIAQVERDLRSIVRLVADGATGLFARRPRR